MTLFGYDQGVFSMSEAPSLIPMSFVLKQGYPPPVLMALHQHTNSWCPHLQAA